MKHGADPKVKDGDGMTPLVWGCLYDDRRLVQLALAQGADVNVESLVGTPLMVAAMKGHAETVQTLLLHGANVNAKTMYGETALVTAFGWGPPPPNVATIIKILLAHGANVDAKNVQGESLMKMAADCHRPDLAALLKRYGAKK
jgi:ankyrin repeat protein